MERAIVIIILVVGLAAGGAYLLQTNGNPNPQSAYVPQPGDCIVLPQGQDAVYDLFYAKEVNPLNCTSFKTQEEAQYIEAQTRALDAETTRGNFWMRFMVVLVVCVVAFFVYAATRG